MKSFEYVMPESVAGAIEQRTGGAVFKAGGMDLLDLMKSGVVSPDRVVGLHRVEMLRGISMDESGATIGALTTLSEIAAHPDVSARFAALSQAAGQAATPQVRNVATLGGNILQRPRCWYFRLPEYRCLKKGGDTCFAMDGENKFHAIFDTDPCPIVHASNTAVALMALRAKIHAASRDGAREIAAENFFVTPRQDMRRENILKDDEVVTRIFVPATPARSAFIEFREKQSFDWALVSAAAVASVAGKFLRNVRLVLGAVSPVPRLIDVGEIEAEEEQLASFAMSAVRDAAPLSQNRYKVQLAKVAIRRILRTLAEGA